ncbi:MAG: tyrosine-type recombinase/integrase [Clostridium sp.]
MTDRTSSTIQAEMIEEFQEYLRKEERAAATIMKYSHDLRMFITFLSGRAVDKEQVIRYKEWLLRSYRVRSVNSMIAALNCFLEFAGWREYRVKLVKVQRKLCSEEAKELQKKEYVRLIQTAQSRGKERLAILMQTLCSLGLRVSELHFVTVEAVKTGSLQIFNKGKNRSMIVSGKLRQQLLLYIKKQELSKGEIFITRTGRPMDRSNIWREMKSLYIEAHVMAQKIFPHNLRHLFARTFYAMGKDVVKLADIMGHSNIETTRIYTMSSGREYRQQLEALELML